MRKAKKLTSAILIFIMLISCLQAVPQGVHAAGPPNGETVETEGNGTVLSETAGDFVSDNAANAGSPEEKTESEESFLEDETGVETENDMSSPAASDSESQTEAGLEADSDSNVGSDAGGRTGEGAAAPAEKEIETETGIETESESATESEAETETERKSGLEEDPETVSIPPEEDEDISAPRNDTDSPEDAEILPDDSADSSGSSDTDPDNESAPASDDLSAEGSESAAGSDVAEPSPARNPDTGTDANTNTETEIESETGSDSVTNPDSASTPAPAVRSASPQLRGTSGDSTWQEHFTYTLDTVSGEIRLLSFCNDATDVTVSAQAVVDGQAYQTVICESGLFSGSSVVTARFEDGVRFSGSGMTELFMGCASLESAEFGICDVSGVSCADSMFEGCSSLEAADLGNLDFSLNGLQSASRMFFDCLNLTEADLGDGFRACYEDGGGAAVSADVSYLFFRCGSLRKAYLGNGFWESRTENIHARSASMFGGCNKLLEVYLPEEADMSNASLGTGPWYRLDAYGTQEEVSFSAFTDIRSGEAGYAAGWWCTAAKVSFKAMGGAAAFSKKQAVWRTAIGELPAAQKEGYSFGGWYTKGSGGTQIGEDTAVSQEAYYAHWTPVTYTLKINGNGGEGSFQDRALSYNEAFVLRGDYFSNEGYSLKHYSTRANGGGDCYDAGEAVMGLTAEDGGTVELFAVWEADPEAEPVQAYTVSFLVDGDPYGEAVQVPAGSQLPLPAVPQKEGYTFLFWEDGADVVVRDGDAYCPEGDLVLSAWWGEDYFYTFVMEEWGLGTETMEFPDYEFSYEPPALGGYLFDGWYYDQACSEKVPSSAGSSGVRSYSPSRVLNGGSHALALYAKYIPVIRYDPNGGHITESVDPGLLHIDDREAYAVEQFPSVTRDGHVLDGWYTAKSGGTKVETGDVLSLVDFPVLYAHWTAKQTVRLTYDRNADALAAACPGADPPTLSVTYCDGAGTREATPDGDPVVTCYAGEKAGALARIQEVKSGMQHVDVSFLGWYTAAAGGERITEETVLDTDTTAYAHWSAAAMEVYFHRNGGDNVHGISGESKTVEVGGVPTAYTYAAQLGADGRLQTLPGAYRAGYVLEGWYPAPDGSGEKLTTQAVIAEPTVYYAKWAESRQANTSGNISYVWDASWANASNENADNVGGRLVFHPTMNSAQSATLHVMFELNGAVDSTLPEGAVRIRVPKHVFFKKNGAAADWNNISSNLPRYPSSRPDMFFSYMDDGDSYIILNNTPLSGGAGVDATISYTLDDTRKVQGGAQDPDGNYLDGYPYFDDTVTVEFTVDEDGDGTPDAAESAELGIEMHTKAVYDAEKQYVETAYGLEKGDGVSDEGDEGSFYIRWNLRQIKDMDSQYSTQGYTLEYSEDTVHDGTALNAPCYKDGGYSGRIITKHPLSLLGTEEARTTGILIQNDIQVRIIWDSGYVEYRRYPASARIYAPAYPFGEFDKRDINYPDFGWYSLPGGQEAILEDGEDAELGYELVYHGGSNEIPSWDGEAGTYTARERTIRITDGEPGDVLYSSGAALNRFAWEPDTGNITLNDNDYSFGSIRLGLEEYHARYADGLWSGEYPAEGDIGEVELWLRRKGENSYSLFDTVRVEAGIPIPVYTTDEDVLSYDRDAKRLPGDVAAYRIVHVSDYYSTKLTAYVKLLLHPTSHVRSLLKDDALGGDTSVIKNAAKCEISSEGLGTFFYSTNRQSGNRSALKEAYELGTSETALSIGKKEFQEDPVAFDVDRGTQEAKCLIYAYNENDGGRVKSFSEGTFYDLLPAGTTVDEGTVAGYTLEYSGSIDSFTEMNLKSYMGAARMDRSFYSVSFDRNWQGSGRTMMAIRMGLPSGVKANLVCFTYRLQTTYENIVEHGVTMENDVAFANTAASAPAYHRIDGSDYRELAFGDLFRSLDLLHEKIGYAFANVNFMSVDAFSWGFHKTVMTKSSYEASGETVPDNEYTYRLSYAQSQYAKSDRIVFYDILEAGTDTRPSEWHGTFESVDVSGIEGIRSAENAAVACAPAVYYATKPRNAFTAADYDVSNTATWSTARPSDLSLVTAVAVDCSKGTDGNGFVVADRAVLSVYITMRAPAEAVPEMKSTTNEGVCYARKEAGGSFPENTTPEYSEATVVLKDTDVSIAKSSDPESGTAAAPAPVYKDEPIRYILAVTNDDEEFSVHDVQVEDTLPEGMDPDWNAASVFGDDPENAVPVSASPRASLFHSGQSAVFTIPELSAGETLRILIPAAVTTDEAVFENTGTITRVNEVEKHIPSNTTYHETGPTTAVFSKCTFGTAQRLSGASLELRTQGGRLIDAWTTSDEEDHEVEIPAGVYTLRETAAPENYRIADSITFTAVGGKIFIDGTQQEKVVMYDRKNFEHYHFEKAWQTTDEDPQLILGLSGSSAVSRDEELAARRNQTFTITAEMDGAGGSGTGSSQGQDGGNGGGGSSSGSGSSQGQGSGNVGGSSGSSQGQDGGNSGESFDSVSFQVQAGANGEITIPAEYEGYDKYSFTVTIGERELSLTYHVEDAEAPEKPGQLVLTTDRTVKNMDGTTADMIVLKKSDSYEADYLIQNDDGAPLSFTEAYPEGWHPPVEPDRYVAITFGDDFSLAQYDYLSIYYEDEEGQKCYYGEGSSPTLSGNAYKGTSLAGKTIVLPSDRFWLYLHAGYVAGGHGFTVTDISAADASGLDENAETISASVPDYSLNGSYTLSGDSYPESLHDYGIYESYLWHYDASGLFGDSVEAILITQDSDGFLVHVLNEGRKRYAVQVEATTTGGDTEIPVNKVWTANNQPIAFNVIGTGQSAQGTQNSPGSNGPQSAGSVEKIEIMDDTAEHILETISGNGALISQATYDPRETYKACVTFLDGTTTTVTVNPSPFTEQEVTITFDDTDGAKTTTLNAENNWTNAVTLKEPDAEPTELTTGEWESLWERDPETGAITFTNQITAEIPTVTVYTPDVPWIVQTGNNGLPNVIYLVFAGSLLATVILILKGRKYRK